MSLFRNENPNLGAQTTLQELSGFGSGTPLVSNFKPTTREIIQFGQTSATLPSAAEFVFIAPWACTVLAVKSTFSTASSSGTLQVARFTQGSLPSAPSTSANGTTILNMLSSTVSLSGTANTTTAGSLSTASGSPLVLAAGDQLAVQLGGTLTGLVGLYIQIELAQVG